MTVALSSYGLFWQGSPADDLARIAWAGGAIALQIAVAHLLGLYENDERRADHSTVDEIFPLFQSLTITAWLVLSFSLLAHGRFELSTGLLALWGLAFGLLFCSRILLRALYARLGSQGQRTVIVGAGEVGYAIAHKLLRNPRLGMNLVGFIDGYPLKREGELSRVPVLGDMRDLETLIGSQAIERVIVAFSGAYDAQLLALTHRLTAIGVRVDIVPRLFESVGLRANLHTLEGLPLIGLTPTRPADASLRLKRIADAVLATLCLIALAPLLGLIALAIKLDSPGSVFYLSERVGRGGARFELCKFRTMHNRACRGERYGAAGAEQLFSRIMDDPAREAEFQRTHKLRSDPRVTRLGVLLRRTSLDELPQLMNVIRGHLSLVGPRPVMAYEVRKQEELARGELERVDGAVNLTRPVGYWELDTVRPGMTGYWQVMARSNVGYEERLHLDRIYTTSWSLRLDLLIVIRTLGVLAGRGAY